ncbi:hypothetical protein [Aurantimonas sp. HBX-1]|uniref:hypothetical protein n=1 Tax=Aurantimonas sp. HBX-1 TaxID=2906072 RepID=UPI001F167ADA|nr:hypothetical protein [Aurantimonas sp. HBX-1]UIJ71920.1 hypothetical protein LXB15_19930 [Aurantimonas sp. HBX-1]
MLDRFGDGRHSLRIDVSVLGDLVLQFALPGFGFLFPLEENLTALAGLRISVVEYVTVLQDDRTAFQGALAGSFGELDGEVHCADPQLAGQKSKQKHGEATVTINHRETFGDARGAETGTTLVTRIAWGGVEPRSNGARGVSESGLAEVEVAT